MNTKRNRSSGRPGTVARSIVPAGIVALLALPVTPLSAARANQTLRSGTIVSGTGETVANPWVTGMEGCVGAPTCSAWLQSGCAPALAGADPALHTSIVDVADLADGVTPRVLRTRRGVPISGGGTLVVQFWTRSDQWDFIDEPAGLDGERCWELLDDRLTWPECPSFVEGCTFRIPAAAEFITISAEPDTTEHTWTLS